MKRGVLASHTGGNAILWEVVQVRRVGQMVPMGRMGREVYEAWRTRSTVVEREVPSEGVAPRQCGHG